MLKANPSTCRSACRSVYRSVGRRVRWFVHSFLWYPLPTHDKISILGLYNNIATNVELTELCDRTFVNRRGKQSKSSTITFAVFAPLSAKSMWHLQQRPEWPGLLGPAQSETPRFRQCSTSHPHKYGISLLPSTALHAPKARDFTTP